MLGPAFDKIRTPARAMFAAVSHGVPVTAALSAAQSSEHALEGFRDLVMSQNSLVGSHFGHALVQNSRPPVTFGEFIARIPDALTAAKGGIDEATDPAEKQEEREFFAQLTVAANGLVRDYDRRDETYRAVIDAAIRPARLAEVTDDIRYGPAPVSMPNNPLEP